MKILKLLNRKHLSIIVVFFLICLNIQADEKPIDIWNIDNKEIDKKSVEKKIIEEQIEKNGKKPANGIITTHPIRN